MASLADRLRLPALIRVLPRKPSLLILNYHRIGDPSSSPFDPGIFSATPEHFEAQIRFAGNQAEFIGLKDLLALAEGTRVLQRPEVMVTFDDGYRDNYQLAFPILRSLGIQGVFFLPTSLTGTNKVPWWDAISYLIRHARTNKVSLTYPRPIDFDLSSQGLGVVVREILKLYKLEDVDETRFIAELAVACGSEMPNSAADRLFLDWSEASAMIAGGMAIGSHTHSHDILARRSPAEQYEELSASRTILEERLGVTVDTLAYPVGRRGTFNDETIVQAQKAGYRAAFSNYGGFTTPSSMRPFDIPRFSIDRQTMPRFRTRVSLGLATAKYWP